MIGVMNQEELYLNYCMLFVNISYYEPQIKKIKTACGGSLVVQKTSSMAFWICNCTVALNKGCGLVFF